LRKAAEQLASSGSFIEAVLVEDKASGQSLVQDLQQTTRLPVLPIKVDSDKITRAHVVVPTVEAGRVFAPADAAWLDVFLKELASFPKGKNDDLVDAFTQGARYLLDKIANLQVWEALAEDGEEIDPGISTALGIRPSPQMPPRETREQFLDRRKREGRERVEAENERQREAARIRDRRAAAPELDVLSNQPTRRFK
jgi:predicted phage terminase large subunit-like protein